MTPEAMGSPALAPHADRQPTLFEHGRYRGITRQALEGLLTDHRPALHPGHPVDIHMDHDGRLGPRLALDQLHEGVCALGALGALRSSHIIFKRFCGNVARRPVPTITMHGLLNAGHQAHALLGVEIEVPA
jgi:hypothetical protein